MQGRDLKGFPHFCSLLIFFVQHADLGHRVHIIIKYQNLFLIKFFN